jgi:hypothetical protein
MPLAQDRDYLFLGGHDEVVKISKRLGSVASRIPLGHLAPPGHPQGGYNPEVSEVDDRLYVPTGYSTTSGLAGNLLCFDSRTDEFLWGFSVSEENAESDIESCALKDSFVVFPTGQKMIALNRYTGAKLWSTHVAGDGFWWSPTISGTRVYMGSASLGRMYAFDLFTGTLQWRSEETKGSIITFITVQEDRIFFCNGNSIWVLDSSTGATIWHGLPPEYLADRNALYMSPVAVGEGHMVCVGSKRIYCLTIPSP